MKLPLVPTWLTTSDSSDALQAEKKIRQQILDLETQASTLNEAISLLRAVLSHSSESERTSLELLEEWQNLPVDTTLPPEKMNALVQHLVGELWCSHLLYNHALRQLYPRLIEGKRQMLHHWVRWLQQSVEELPDNRQPLVRSLLDNCVQGTLSAGVQQLESSYARQLQKVKKETRESPRLASEPPTLEVLKEWLNNETVSAMETDHEEEISSFKGDALAQDDS